MKGENVEKWFYSGYSLLLSVLFFSMAVFMTINSLNKPLYFVFPLVTGVLGVNCLILSYYMGFHYRF